jgi:tetratricopeptide (TPR) repeat protein
LLVFDDVWSQEDAAIFDGVGVNCRRIVTTRIPDAAIRITTPVLKLQELAFAASEQLLERHCEKAREKFGDRLDPVLRAIAGLPLTLVLVGKNLYRISYKMGPAAANEFLEKLLRPDERLKLQVEDSQDQGPLGPGEHLTLDRVMNLTISRLTPEQVVALRALTVFPPKANTFSLPAGRVVAVREERFEALVSSGLVEPYGQMDGRFTIHQAIVDFARQGRSGDKGAYRRMTNYFIDCVSANTKHDQPAWTWVAALRPEGDNLRAALAWTVSARETRLGMRLMAALWPYWYHTSQFRRARDLAEQVLDLPEPPDASQDDHLLRAKLLNDAGNYAYNMSDLDTAERLHTWAKAIRVKFSEEALTAGSLNNLGLVLRERGNYVKARHLFLRAKDLNERTQHEEWRLWRGMNLNNLGVTSARAGDLDRALKEQLDAVEAFRSVPDEWGVAMAQTDLAEVLIELGQADKAELILDGILPKRVSDDDAKAVAAVLRAQAAIQLSRGKAGKARTLLLASMNLSAPISDRLGQGKCLERLIIAAYEAADFALSARAEGALQAYQEASGVRTASRVAARLQQILTATTSGDFDQECAAARDAARSMASGGLVALLEALGPAVNEVVTEQVVIGALRERS